MYNMTYKMINRPLTNCFTIRQEDILTLGVTSVKEIKNLLRDRIDKVVADNTEAIKYMKFTRWICKDFTYHIKPDDLKSYRDIFHKKIDYVLNLSVNEIMYSSFEIYGNTCLLMVVEDRVIIHIEVFNLFDNDVFINDKILMKNILTKYNL